MGLLRIGRPQTPSDWVALNEDMKEDFDVLWCPECRAEVNGSLSVHVNNAADHPSLEDFKGKYEGMPLVTDGLGDNIADGLTEDFGAFDWDRLEADRKTITHHRDWLLTVEMSGLIADQAIFEDLVEYYNAHDWWSMREGVATSLLIALNDYSYIGASEVADELDIGEKTLRRRKKDHPETTPDVRTPQELLRDKLEDSEVGVEEYSRAYEELLSYPEEFRHGGRQPSTIAALTAWRAIERITQKWAADMFDVTTASITNAKNDLENRQR